MLRQRCIPAEEFAQRLRRAQTLLQDTDLDLLWVNSNQVDFANVRYFSDFWPMSESAGVIIPREGEPTLLIGPESTVFA